MSVDNWARREAERQYPRTYRYDGDDWPNPGSQEMRDGAVWMARHLADAFLSDEAVQLAATELAYKRWPDDTVQQDPETIEFMVEQVRETLQAAIDAVTKEARND